MKTLYIAEAEKRKDFLENWKSIRPDIVIPKFGMPTELNYFRRMCEQNMQGFSISNTSELRIEYAYLGGISRNFKHLNKKYVSGGLPYTWKQIPKEYHNFLIQDHRSLIIKAIQGCKPEDRLKVEAFVDFRYKYEENKTDHFRILQHIKTFEADKDNTPIFSINFFSDITHLKKKDDCTLAIKMPDGIVNFYKFDVNSKIVSDFGPITKREICILQLLSRGLSSRQIGDILCISPHTVDTHRRNILDITNCVDTTALIVYCSLLGIY
jgi:DNA-binding CsgD family transcriptional regulator